MLYLYVALFFLTTIARGAQPVPGKRPADESGYSAPRPKKHCPVVAIASAEEQPEIPTELSLQNMAYRPLSLPPSLLEAVVAMELSRKLKQQAEIRNKLCAAWPIECIKCTERYPQVDQLRKHEEKEHAGMQLNGYLDHSGGSPLYIRHIQPITPPPTCSVCSRTFDYPCTLKTHMNSHLKQKPFICHIPGCGRGYANNSGLNRHRKAKHANPSNR